MGRVWVGERCMPSCHTSNRIGRYRSGTHVTVDVENFATKTPPVTSMPFCRQLISFCCPVPGWRIESLKWDISSSSVRWCEASGRRRGQYWEEKLIKSHVFIPIENVFCICCQEQFQRADLSLIGTFDVRRDQVRERCNQVRERGSQVRELPCSEENLPAASCDGDVLHSTDEVRTQKVSVTVSHGFSFLWNLGPCVVLKFR